MKNIIHRNSLVVVLITPLLCFQASCRKDWLDAKPDKSLVVPGHIENYQALLDNAVLMNSAYPGMGVISDDNITVSDATFQALSKQEKSAYTWESTDNFYDGSTSVDWSGAYSRILNTNIVLKGIQQLKTTPQTLAAFNNVKGTALFFRSMDFFNLAQLYCKVYTPASANTDPGLPPRTDPNINLFVPRSSVQQTYDRILTDLLSAVRLLPNVQAYVTRPSKAAVYGLLSRVYLSMENYSQSLVYADSCLQLSHTLMDFNTLNASAAQPFARYNSEVIFHSNLTGYAVFRTSRLIVSPDLISEYQSNDLRKVNYFTTATNKTFKGSYDGSLLFFCGISTDEVYLNRAECYARAGNSILALQDLNTLLKTRWKKNMDGSSTYIDHGASTSDEALSIILKERRKELCFRALRWTDLRRLNKDERFKKTVTRTVNGQHVILEPTSPRYVLPLDEKEIQTGQLLQNQR